MTATDHSTLGDATGRIIPFRARSGAPFADPQARAPDPAPPVSDLSEFERTVDNDDYRHRMIVNGAALAFTVLLVAAGIWIADSMAAIRKNQDCVLMGRRSCTPVTALPTDRWSGSAPVQQRAASDRGR